MSVAHAAEPMIWTRRQPTEPGYYWYRDHDGETIVQVESGRWGWYVRLFGGDDPEPLVEFDRGQWSGPLPAPR